MKYTIEELSTAYWAWALEKQGREPQWDAYCDVRDCVPLGTNAKIRQERNNEGDNFLQLRRAARHNYI
jgi:hypothetical protein